MTAAPGLEPLDRTRARLAEMATELRHDKPGAYTQAVADRVPSLLDEVERLRDRLDGIERAETAILGERDRNEEWADKLAAAIAKHLGIDIGEHSNMNDPWANAIEALKAARGRAIAQDLGRQIDAHGEAMRAEGGA